MAEGVLKDMAEKHGLDWEIDSAGTEYYHVGEKPDRRAISQCRKCEIDISHQRARRITSKDFEEFDIIYALADNVLDELREMKSPGKNHSSLRLLLDELYPGENRSVPDPWYGTEEDFQIAYDLIYSACEAIIKRYAVLKTMR